MKISRWNDTLKELAGKSIGEVDYAISMLMSRSRLRMTWKIEPEQLECIQFADELRKATTEKRLKAIWCHVGNEGKRSLIVALILKAMGLIPGAHDYWFIGQNKGVLIEFKRPDKVLPKDFEENQKYFQLWAESVGVKCFLHNKVFDALQTLRNEGLLA